MATPTTYPGSDRSQYDENWLVEYWAFTNLHFVNFYLANLRGGSRGSSVFVWEAALILRDCGWRLWPLWVPFRQDNVVQELSEFILDANGHSVSNPQSRLADLTRSTGTTHGQSAANLAANFGIEKGATLYLDLEAPVLSNLRTADGPAGHAIDYVQGWSDAVRGAGYQSGLYCSFLDANTALALHGGSSVCDAVWPFQVNQRQGMLPRDSWDPGRGLAALPVNQWEDVANPSAAGWASKDRAIGVQQSQPGNVRVSWQAGGRVESFTGIDWDSAKSSDPAHPRAAMAIAVSIERTNQDFVRGFALRAEELALMERQTPHSGDMLSPPLFVRLPGRKNLKDGDLAEPWSGVAAVSRAKGHHDVFWIHRDGWVKTSWETPTAGYTTIGQINRVKPANPGDWVLARKGTPLAATCVSTNRLDVFYVDRDHRLFHQWWEEPNATRWETNGDWLGDPGVIVAPASNLVALPSPSAPPASNSPRPWDIFFIGANDLAGPHRSRRPPTSNALAASPRSPSPPGVLSWLLGANHDRSRFYLSGASGAAAPQTVVIDSQTPPWGVLSVATGVAANRGVDDMIHLVFQERQRPAWRPQAGQSNDSAPTHEIVHLELAANSLTLHGAPVLPQLRRSVIRLAPSGDAPQWFTSLHLLARPRPSQPKQTELLLIALDNNADLRWFLFDGATWGSSGQLVSAASDPRFCTGRRFQVTLSTNWEVVDVLGTAEDGSPIHVRLQWQIAVTASAATRIL